MFRRYKKIELIERGGYGEVWKAHDALTRNYVAIKFLVKDDAESYKMFQREIRELSNLINNPHIVRITDSSLSTPTPFYVMEFCDGGVSEIKLEKLKHRKLSAF